MPRPERGSTLRKQVGFARHPHFEREREHTFQPVMQVDTRHFYKGAFRYVADVGGRRLDKPQSFSRSSHSCGIQADRNRGIVSTHHSATDGLGGTEHEVDYKAPKEICGWNKK